jgi:radical SAM protein with 4Fe4S-binding SPASM domain|tara:strand:- start:4771 stop:5595 length:825 start_codon:yes stop_codon:yes gene_type:complete
MDQKKYERSIDEVTGLGCKQVTLTGFGEPLLDKNLEKKISYAKSKGLRTYVITNGSLLQKRGASLADSGLDELRISFYGMSAETYNEIMFKLDFQKSKKGILEFLETRKDTKVMISYLIFHGNEHYNEFLDFWEHRVDSVEVWKPHNFTDGRHYRSTKGIKTSCGRPESGPLQIQWNGEVIPCCFDYNNQIVLGNAFETPVMEVLYGKKYNKLRKAHKQSKFHKFPLCYDCDQLIKHDDALIYTNRHNLPNSEAVKLSNTDLTNLKNRIPSVQI